MPPSIPTGRACSLSRDAVREFDRRAIEVYGLPGVVLMENAGRNAARLLVDLWPHAGLIAVVCGRGNNGGDGFVIARHLELHGRRVRILLAVDPGSIAGDAAMTRAVASRAGIPIVPLATADPGAWRQALADATVVVDALLGTGATGAPRGGVATAITAIDAWRGVTPTGRILSVDLPSGLDCDTGAAPGACVRADATATFVARKRGFDMPGAEVFTGAVHVLDIGAPRCLLTEFGLP